MTIRVSIKQALAAAALAFVAAASPSQAEPRTAAAAVAGGIGAVEREHLFNNPLSDRNVKLVFSLDTGNYLADVHVRVTGTGGAVVVDGVARGPWVYATLPTGEYLVTATYVDQIVKRRLDVVDDRRIVAHLAWPASVEERASASTGVKPILGTADGSLL